MSDTKTDPKPDQQPAAPGPRDSSETMAATLAAMGEDIFKPDPAPGAITQPAKPAEPDKPKPAADDFDSLGDIGDKPKPTAQPADEFEEPKGLSEKGKADWSKIREARRKSEERAAQAERERDELKTKFNPEEVEGLKKRVEDYDARLRMVGLEKHPDFQRHFDGQKEVILAQAKKVAGDLGDRAAQILSLPDSKYRTEQLDMLLDELPSRTQQNQIGALVNELDRVQATKESEIERYSKNYKEIQERDRRAAQQRQENALQQFEAKLSQLGDPERGIAVLKEREGDKEWNSQVLETRALARRIFKGELQPEEFVRSAIYAAMTPAVLKHSKAQQARISELEQTIAKLKSGQPGPGGEKDSRDDEGEGDRGFIDSVTRLAVKEGVFGR